MPSKHKTTDIKARLDKWLSRKQNKAVLKKVKAIRKRVQSEETLAEISALEKSTPEAVAQKLDLIDYFMEMVPRNLAAWDFKAVTRLINNAKQEYHQIDWTDASKECLGFNFDKLHHKVSRLRLREYVLGKLLQSSQFPAGITAQDVADWSGGLEAKAIAKAFKKLAKKALPQAEYDETTKTLTFRGTPEELDAIRGVYAEWMDN